MLASEVWELKNKNCLAFKINILELCQETLTHD